MRKALVAVLAAVVLAGCTAFGQRQAMTRHTKISFIKSAVRIVGFACLTLPQHALGVTAAVLIAAELLGVLEEVGAQYT